MKKGLYIVIEGTEGAGKTTQLQKVKQYLEDGGIDVLTSREPGATPLGQEIRRILLDLTESPKLSTASQVMLFAAAYQHTLLQNIIPAIERGTWILSDRSNISSFVYQREAEITQVLLEENNKLCEPDLVFILTTSYETYRNRVGNRTGYSNYKDDIAREQHTFLTEGYNLYYQTHPNNTIMIDAERTEHEIFEEIISYLIVMGMHK